MTQRPTPQELEEAKARAERAESEAAAWKADAATAHLKNQELRASLLEAVGALTDARDLLMERKYGSHARSPAHNARLVLDGLHTRLSSSLEGGEGSGWLPIESAPKDGTRFRSQDRVNYGRRVFAGTHWYAHPSVSGWVTDELDCGDNEFEPTHWKLPPPPEHQGGE